MAPTRDGGAQLGKGGLLVLHLDEASAVTAVERLPASSELTAPTKGGTPEPGGWLRGPYAY